MRKNELFIVALAAALSAIVQYMILSATLKGGKELYGESSASSSPDTQTLEG